MAVQAKGIQSVLDDINKHFKGKFAIMGDDIDTEVTRIPVQSLRLNWILGGGFPKNKITEIYGPEHTGKSGIAYGALAEAQKQGLYAALVDVENAFEPEFAELIGLNTSKLIYIQPESGEQAFDIAERLIRSGELGAIVFDSVPALVPKAVLDAEMEQQGIGQLARLMSKGVIKILGALRDSGCACIFINQQRVKVGAYAPHGMEPLDTCGGKALKYYSSVRIEVRRGHDIKDGDEVLGHELKCFSVKNRTHKPKQRCVFNIIYGQGIDHMEEVANLAIETDLIKKGGAWLSLVDDNGVIQADKEGNLYRWQGFDKYNAYLKENPEFYQMLFEKLINPPQLGAEEVTALQDE